MPSLCSNWKHLVRINAGMVPLPRSLKLEHTAAGWDGFAVSDGRQTLCCKLQAQTQQSMEVWESVSLPKDKLVSSLSAGEKHRCALTLL